MTTEEQVTTDQPIQLVKIADIDVPPSRIRSHYDEEALAGLKETIRRVGLINPITLYRVGERFGLSTGTRRLRVFQDLELTEIPARIIPPTQKDRVALIENIQREDLSPLDEAEILHSLRQMEGCQLDELAGVVGKSIAWVSNTLALRGLPERVKGEIDGSITKNALAELTRLKDPKMVVLAWEELKAAGGTVAAARQIVSKYLYLPEGGPEGPQEMEGDDQDAEPPGKGRGSRKVYFRSLLRHGETVQRGLAELDLRKVGEEKAPHLVKMLLELQEAIRVKLEEMAVEGRFDLENGGGVSE